MMGFVSLSEDIEELRQDNEHYRRGIDGIIKVLRKNPSLQVVQRLENDCRKLGEQLARRYEEHLIHAKERFEEAIKYLRDPSVLITEKLRKRTQERDEARAELRRCKADLELCRKSQVRIQKRLNELVKENRVTHAAIEKLNDEAQWQDELKSVRPLRK